MLKICQQCVCGRGSAPDPTGGAYSAPPEPLAGKGEGPPGWPQPGRGDPREGEGRKKRGWGGGRGKLLPPDVRFYG